MTTRRNLNASASLDISKFLTPSTRAPRTSTPLAKSKRKATFVRPICDTCQTCGKQYRCHRSYVKHARGHKIVEQASHLPKVHDIMQHLSSNCGNVFRAMILQPAYGATGRAYKEFLETVINSYGDWINFAKFMDAIHGAVTEGLQDSKFMLPSSLTALLQKNAERLLSNVSARKNISELFKVCYTVEERIFQLFLPGYVLYLVTDILKFISTSLRSRITTTPPTEEGGVINNEYLETIHYVAGAKTRAFYKKSLQFPKHTAWRNIGRVISERLLESETVPGPPGSVKGWTMAQSRGRLFFVSGILFDFFCGVARELEKQTSKVRVDCEAVIEKLCENGIVILWDDAVGDSMSQTESFNFMSGMIRAFCQTFGVGKSQRMINAIRKKGEASIPLRHRVAPKSNPVPSAISK